MVPWCPPARRRRSLWRGLLDQPGDDFGLVPLRPVGGIVDKLQIRVPEQSSEVAREPGVEVIVGRAENQRDRQVETGQVTGGDVLVLLIECGKQGGGPGPDGGEGVRLVTVTEELRQDRSE